MTDLLGPLLSATPWVLLWIVAGVLAAVWWTRHPTASALLITASVIHVITTIASHLIPIMMLRNGQTHSAMSLVMGGVGVVSLVGSALLVGAVFAGRQDGRPGGVP